MYSRADLAIDMALGKLSVDPAAKESDIAVQESHGTIAMTASADLCDVFRADVCRRLFIRFGSKESWRPRHDPLSNVPAESGYKTRRWRQTLPYHDMCGSTHASVLRGAAVRSEPCGSGSFFSTAGGR